MNQVVIAGAGVIGAATAFFLSRRGVRTTVIERRAIASGASGTAAGLLSPPSPEDLREPWGRLARASLDLHFSVARELDGDSRYGFEPVDLALVARDAREREAIVAVYGAEAWLDAPELRERCPWAGPEFAGGVIRAGGAQLFPGLLTGALLEAASAEVVEAGVEDLVRHGDVATGLHTDRGDFVADAVVLAMGPWTGAAAEWLGIPVPVSPLKGQILRLEAPRAPAGGFADIDGNYLVRKPDGVVFTGTTEEDAGFDETPTPVAEARMMQWALQSAPALQGARVIARTACLRPLSADNAPIIGAVPGVKGVVLATGHGRKGILLSLATGRAVAELLVDAASTSADLAPFDPARFMGGVAG